MRRTRLGTAGIALVALLAFPRASDAGLADFIWELSGPPMIGLVFYCEYNPDGNRTECRAFDRRVFGNAGTRRERRFWVLLPAGGYVSTGQNADMGEFGFGDVRMLALEPTVEVRSLNPRGFVLHHGVIGLSYMVVGGSGFNRFDKLGLKFVPVGVTFANGFNIAYNLRVFPNGFTPDEFGVGPRLPDLERKTETVHGVIVGWGYDF